MILSETLSILCIQVSVYLMDNMGPVYNELSMKQHIQEDGKKLYLEVETANLCHKHAVLWVMSFQ